MAHVTDTESLRRIYPDAKGRATKKVLPKLEVHSKKFISLSPFLLIGTQGLEGGSDVSPKGEDPGFVQVLDNNTIAIPDRPGNNRLDGFQNILENPKVGLIFLIPGVDETLRNNGHSEITDDAELLARFDVNGKQPRTVLVVRIDEVFLHCAKALVRSKLWDPAARIDREELPTMSRIINDYSGADTPEESREEMMARYEKVLY